MQSELIGGRFRLHRMLGAGAMGQVWLATDERLQRSVAVKIVLPDAQDAQLGLRLEREARAAAAIQHTNVVRVFDYLEDGARTLIVMEHVDGETLSERLHRDGAMSIEDALDYAAQICDGLFAAHRTGLVHRDLKPSNVMITDDGLAKVLDFGIAKRTDHGEQNLTMTGAVIGTPRYMAPEQLQGEQLDARVDIHAAGLLLYEMIAGRPAFDRENFAELMYQVVQSPADLTPIEARGVPPQVIAILSRALAKKRDERWPDAKSMSDALRVCLYGDVLSSRKTPTTAGLRSIIDSGERLLQAEAERTSAAGIAAATAPTLLSPPVTATPTPMGAAAVPPAVPPPATPRVSVADRHTPTTPRWPLVVVPAVVLVAIAGFVMTRGGSTTADTTAAPAAAVGSAPDATAPSTDTTAKVASAPTAPASKPAPPVAPPSPAPVSTPAAEKPATTKADDAKNTESVRRALSGAVEATWRFYLKEVTKEYGDEIQDLNAEFDVVVDNAGQFSLMRPRRLTEEAVFNDNASLALQNAAPIRIGSAQRASGFPLRVRFSGQTVRVSTR